MAITITTTEYLAAHGRKPKGLGAWGFQYRETVQLAHGTVQVPRFMGLAPMTYREACAYFRKQMRHAGYQDLTATLAS